MPRFSLWHVRRAPVCLLMFSVLVTGLAAPARAYKPEDPEIQAMIERGITYLEGAQHDEFMGTLGGKCLVALAIYKHRKDRSHPKIAVAVADCQRHAAEPNRPVSGDFNYSLGLAIILLCELDAQAYSSEIQSLLGVLKARQKPYGAWGYPDYKTGDTSQTQYAALGSWMAHTHGFQVDLAAVEAMGNWLMRVQDVSGAWPYQGQDPGHYQRIQQNPGYHGITLSMSPAALGSLYITADILQIDLARKQRQDGEPEEEEVFKKVEEPVKAREKLLNPTLLREALRLGDAYFQRAFSIEIPTNQHYYLYSIERYYSFREHMEKNVTAEPAWYNAGVDYLKASQAEDGSWAGMRDQSIDTAFSTLFLMRSTKQVIRSVSEGNLVGGHGLPADLTKIRLKDGDIVGTDTRGDIGGLLDLLESGELADTDALLAQLDDLQFDTSKEKDTAAFDRLKQMVSGESYQARLLAVRALANEGTMENVPVLIYALSDPDPRVAREADAGLRMLSRRFSAPRLPSEPTLEDKRAAQYAWRDWLKSVRPDVEVPPDVFTAGGAGPGT